MNRLGEFQFIFTQVLPIYWGMRDLDAEFLANAVTCYSFVIIEIIEIVENNF